MGRQGLIAALCCLLASAARATGVVKEAGGESARLYRHAPGLVYASSAPYAAYSFHLPAVAPQPAASRLVPVRESHTIQHANGNGYLKDSYGNRFVEALQSMKALPFRPFPQQYVQLQELPAHLAQPLAASFQHQQYQAAPQRPAAAAPAPAHHYTYATAHSDAFKTLSPHAVSYGPHFGSVFHLPVQSAAPTRQPHTVQFTQDSTHSLSENKEQRSAPHQSGHRSVFIEQPQEHYHQPAGEHKFERLQEAPREASSEELATPAAARYVKPKPSTHELVSAVKEIPIKTVVNGKKTVVNVKTKPPLPLLDINLLEPLTFANPLVPQVQHFLPRINQATYHKLPGQEKHEDKNYQKEIRIQKTKSYDSGVVKGKTKKTKKKQKSPPSRHSYDDEYIPAATASPPAVTKMLEAAPEIVYEINTPNGKETIKEKSVKYNKETNSEPVHYSYGTNTRKEPVHYSYTHSSKEPLVVQEVRYEGKGEGPKHLIYTAKPGELSDESDKPKPEAEDSGESDESSEDKTAPRLQHQQQKEHHSAHEAPKTTHHYVPEHREQEYHPRPGAGSQHGEHEHHHSKPGVESHHAHREYHGKPSSGGHHNTHHGEHDYHGKSSSGGHQQVHHGKHEQHDNAEHGHHDPPHREHEPRHRPHPDAQDAGPHAGHHEYPALEVTPHQYEEDISYAAPIKVDPGQHVRGPASRPHHARPDHSPRDAESESGPHGDAPTMHVHEKTKQVYIKEETPEEDEPVGEDLMKKIFGKEEDSEQDFENAYKNAAYGFPAYDSPPADVEKEIYNPESYGAPRDHGAYTVDHAPFQQYQGHGDEFPKQTRLSYQDARDKTKEDYFHDYSVSKPSSLQDRHNNKLGYYKLYNDQKPEKYVAREDDKKQKSAKLTAIPYSYYPAPAQADGMKQFLEQYKAVAAPYAFEYDYSKGFSAVPAKPAAAGDSSARASRPLQRYKVTHFVEPQFQYGFEPVALPRLLDSELAAMASNLRPEGEKPGTRKKVYKENFYIKKTSMSDASPNS